MLKKVLISLGICIAALPVAAIATFFLIPFWRWFDATTEIESIGHSGPSEWCFVAVYFSILIATFGAWFRSQKKA